MLPVPEVLLVRESVAPSYSTRTHLARVSLQHEILVCLVCGVLVQPAAAGTTSSWKYLC